MNDEGTQLGDITLCAHCGFAIQLRRDRWQDWQDNGRWHEADFWMHFRPPILPHTAVPKRCLWDYINGRCDTCGEVGRCLPDECLS